MHMILRNKRVGKNDFSMQYPCDFCDRYTNQVLVLPNTSHGRFILENDENGKPFYASNSDEPKKICKTCLNEMSIALDKNMVDNFEDDYQEARGNVWGKNAPDMKKPFVDIKTYEVEQNPNEEIKYLESCIDVLEEDIDSYEELMDFIEEETNKEEKFYLTKFIKLPKGKLKKQWNRYRKDLIVIIKKELEKIKRNKQSSELEVDENKSFLSGVKKRLDQQEVRLNLHKTKWENLLERVFAIEQRIKTLEINSISINKNQFTNGEE